MRAKRGRGRGDRGRGLDRGGLRSGSGEGAELDSNLKVDYGYSRGFGSYSGGRGRGWSGGRGARGRGIGRGFYEHRGSNGVNQYGVELENQGNSEDWVDVKAEVPGKSCELVENHGPIFESKKFGGQHRNSGWEEKGYDHDNQHFRGGEGRGRRGFGGGRQGSGGGIGQRYIEKEPVLEGKSDEWNGPQNKEYVPTEKEQVDSITLPVDGASGWYAFTYKLDCFVSKMIQLFYGLSVNGLGINRMRSSDLILSLSFWLLIFVFLVELFIR